MATAPIYRRGNEIFFSPAQVTVWLGEYLVEDACMIMVDTQDAWLPHYGYNDRNYRRLSPGQVMIGGRLAIRYRYEGYLTRVVEKMRSNGFNTAPTAEDIAALRKGSARDVSDDTLKQDVDNVLDYLDRSAERGNMKLYSRVAHFLKGRFWRDGGQIGTSDMTLEQVMGNSASMDKNEYEREMEYYRYGRPSSLESPDDLEMSLVHGGDEHIGNPAYTRRFIGVQFVGRSYVANIDVPDGSSPVTEVYPFMARDERPLVLR